MGELVDLLRWKREEYDQVRRFMQAYGAMYMNRPDPPRNFLELSQKAGEYHRSSLRLAAEARRLEEQIVMEEVAGEPSGARSAS